MTQYAYELRPGVEPVTMCLVCLRPALQHMAVESIVTPFWLI